MPRSTSASSSSRATAAAAEVSVAALLSTVWPRNKRLTVSVLADNGPAVAFWRAMGYVDYDLTLEITPRV